MADRRALMAVFAHPDDESFGVGGTLAKYASEGAEVTLVVATNGDAGEISDPNLATPANLAEVRQEELRCAAGILGVRHVRFLNYADGHLAEADQDEAEGRIVALLRELRPQVVITFDPNGVYGHSDHVAVHRLTVAACRSAGDPTRFSQQLTSLRPHSPARVFYRAIPWRAMSLLADRMAAIRRGLGLPSIDPRTLATPEELIVADIDISAFADQKSRAIACHRTQISGEDVTAVWSEEVRREFLTRELFALMEGQRAAGQPLWDDLFAGL